MRTYFTFSENFVKLVLKKEIPNTEYNIGFIFTHEMGFPLGYWEGKIFKSFTQKEVEEMLINGIFEVYEKRM